MFTEPLSCCCDLSLQCFLSAETKLDCVFEEKREKKKVVITCLVSLCCVCAIYKLVLDVSMCLEDFDVMAYFFS